MEEIALSNFLLLFLAYKLHVYKQTTIREKYYVI